MAAAAKSAEMGDAPPAKGGASLVVQLGLLVALTAAAAGMGWVSGGFLTGGKTGEAGAAQATTVRRQAIMARHRQAATPSSRSPP